MQRIGWMLVLVALLVGLQGAAAQSQPGLSMTSEAVSGGWRMVISGESSAVARVCSFGDCTRVFTSPVEATNYFLLLFGLANGIALVPIPSAP